MESFARALISLRQPRRARPLTEPIVRIGCGLAMVPGLLGLFACLAFKLSCAGARFPLAEMLGISLGFGGVLVLSYFLIAILTDSPRRGD